MDLEQKAVMRLQEGVRMSKQLYDGAPLMITYSGGKDSDVVAELAVRHLPHEDFEIVNSHTTADAPQTVRYIRERFKQWELQGVKCSIVYPTYKGKRATMWNLIPRKMVPPTRLMRYCCFVLKETSGKNRFVGTGVRWDESVKRKMRGIYESIEKEKTKRIILLNDNDDRQMLESCVKQNKRVVNPIIDWEENDVWDYLKDIKCISNPLYYCGFDRVGCIGCPMAGKKALFEFKMFPAYKNMYIHAFDRMLEMRKIKGKVSKWKNGADVFEWWTNPQYDPLQIKLEDVVGDDDE